MSVNEREQKILGALYEQTQGDPSSDRSWEAAVRKGEANRQGNWPKDRCLKDALGYVNFNVAGLQIVPGATVLVMPAVLGVTYSAMAQSAWSVGSYMGVAPTTFEEAQYDLVALTTLWCQKIEPLPAFYIALDAMRNAFEGEPFGQNVVRQLVRNGSLVVGRRQFGETGGALVGLAFLETVLEPLVGALWKQFLADAAEGMAEEFIPLVGAVRSVQKARARVTEFYQLAEEYYDAKVRTA